MSLAKGTSLGPYVIAELIGAGGMGEVYKATDTRLNRTVAIKVLPQHFSENREMRQRFEREAQTIASLNHPHICVLHDIGRHEDVDFLVMEYLEGETLARRIERGALPLADALKVAIEVADALDKAHRQRVTHRDLKPSNVMLTPSGAKLLDFGLAKPKHSQSADASSQSPTRSDITEQGAILGTMQYMAPEQLEGQEADARTDIFAFGTILYEMVRGSRAFKGNSQASLISSIMTAEPAPLSTVTGDVPFGLDHVVKKCLAKDPEDRWQSARDLADELQWIGDGEDVPSLQTAPERKKSWLPWALFALASVLTITLAVAGFVYVRGRSEPEEARFLVSVPAASGATDIAVSPNGRLIAFVAGTADGGTALFVRPVASVEFRQLAGTEGAIQPFWSADSRSVGFVSDNRMKIVDLAGGSPQDLGIALNQIVCSGSTLNEDGEIIWAPGPGLGSTLFLRSIGGGEERSISTLDTKLQESGHFWPHFLPDGRHFLYFARSSEPNNSAIYVGSLDSPERTRIPGAESMAVYTEPGYLVFRRGETLWAQPFSTSKLMVTGDPVRIADQIAIGPNGFGAFSVSRNGVMAYRVGGPAPSRQFVWFDRAGNRLGTAGEPGLFNYNFDLSADAKQVAVARLNPDTSQFDIWVIDWARGVPTRFTFDPALGSYGNVVWSPDGSRIAFTSERQGNRDIFVKLTGGTTEETPLLATTNDEWVEDWSKDGRYIIYGASIPNNSGHIYALPTFGDMKPFLVIQSSAADDEPRLSFDGKWLAYNSDESGTHQVYIVSFPEPDRRRQVTASGGSQPRWRKDGKELYYLAPDGKLMAVDIAAGETTIDSGTPRLLFDTHLTVDQIRDQFAVTADGQRFLVETTIAAATPAPITVVLNWTAVLRK
jgi:serine/threonine protein kinase/Tol biopolymer transport system component